MEKINYSQIYAKLTKNLSPKIKNIFERRFGIKSDKIETLESIGQRLGITRERVRQIEKAGFNAIKKHNKETADKILQGLNYYFQEHGGSKREDIALADLGGQKNKPYILFFLAMGQGQFPKICGKKDYRSFWSTIPDAGAKVKESLDSLVLYVKNHGKLLGKEELFSYAASQYNLDKKAILSYLELSTKIEENKEGKIGLVDWPEIKPRNVRDKALLVLKKEQKPLHFTRITELIDTLEFNYPSKQANVQTVHNELIKDQRFVLVGRGTYALSDWGYFPGTIKDIITKVLKEKQQGVFKEDVVKEVLGQRLVAKGTVMVNLNNKKYFQKDSEGKYFLIETQTA